MHQIGDREYIHRERNRLKGGIIRKWIKNNAHGCDWTMQNTNLLFGNRVKCVRWLQYTSKRYKRCCKWEIVRKILEYDLENLKKKSRFRIEFCLPKHTNGAKCAIYLLMVELMV